MKVLFYILIFVFCLFEVATINAQTANITGVVMGEDIRRLPPDGFKPTVTVKRVGSNQKWTENNYNYSFLVPVGLNVKIHYQAAGYSDKNKNEFITSNGKMDQGTVTLARPKLRSDFAQVDISIISIVDSARYGNARIAIYNLMLLKILFSDSTEIQNRISTAQNEIENILREQEPGLINPGFIFRGYEQLIRIERKIPLNPDFANPNYFNLLTDTATPADIKYKLIKILPGINLNADEKTEVLTYLRDHAVDSKDFLFQASLETLGSIGTSEDKIFILKGLNQTNDYERLYRSVRAVGKINLQDGLNTIRFLALNAETDFLVRQSAIESLESFADNFQNLQAARTLIEITENKNNPEQFK